MVRNRKRGKSDTKEGAAPGESSRVPVLWWAMMGLAFVLGAVLRLWGLTEQVLIDDEWHAVDYAIRESYGTLLTHFAAGATSIPMNVYCRALMDTIGLNETWMRLPSLLAGLAALVAFPAYVYRILGKRVALVFAFLLAICPLLVNYSRFARAYGVAVFLCEVSILSGYLWLTTARPRHAFICLAAGTVAIYFHLLAVLAVAPPLLYACARSAAVAWRNRDRERAASCSANGIVANPWKIALMAAAMVAAPCAAMGPALINSLPLLTRATVGYASADWVAVAGAVKLLSGSSNVSVTALFGALLPFGYIHLWRRQRVAAELLAAVALAHVATIAVTRPEGANTPLVLARYCIVLFPLCQILEAIALVQGAAWLAGRLRRGQPSPASTRAVSSALAAGVVTIFFVAGPLPFLYSFPNSFTSHREYQYSYAQQGIQRPYVDKNCPIFRITLEDVPPFYTFLAREDSSRPIIEFPLFIGDNFNIYSYYQRIHRRRVIGGYVRAPQLKTSRHLSGIVPSGITVDWVLGKLKDPEAACFDNLLNILNVQAVRESGADWLVMHKDLLTEELNYPPGAFVAEFNVQLWIEDCRQAYGQPSYEGPRLVAFAIR